MNKKIEIDYSKIETPEQITLLMESLGILKNKLQSINEKEEKEKDTGDDDSNKPEPKINKKVEDAGDDDKNKPDPKDCIFKHIIVFTNSKDPKDNKTLKNIQDSLSKKGKFGVADISLHLFLAEKTWIEDNEETGELKISDGSEEFIVTPEGANNLNTLIFSRLSVQESYDCKSTVQHLQDRGFLVLNPVRYSELASNKYETAELLRKAEIPQPRYALLTKADLNDPKVFLEDLKGIYPKVPKLDGKEPKGTEEKLAAYLASEDQEYVVKILDGHGGTGVFLTNGKRMLAILQTIFAIDPEVNLLVQKKEEADGGDIRVHVLTLRNKQVILGSMKRVKLGNDFRSNVSLGATAEPIELSKDQEEIALKVASLSKLPWCAVDIMPIVKGSNPEFPNNNVVLEINSSPGTAGISEVLKENFIDILLTELDDPNEFMLQPKTAGYKETCTINFDKEGKIKKEFLAKLDTGNSVKACTLEVGKFEVVKKDGKEFIKFEVDGTELEFEKMDEIEVKAGYEEYKRSCIMIPELTLGLRKCRNVQMAIVEHRDNKSTNLLMNTDVLSRLGYIIHPTEKHLLTKEIEKVKIL